MGKFTRGQQEAIDEVEKQLRVCLTHEQRCLVAFGFEHGKVVGCKDMGAAVLKGMKKK